MCVCDRLKKSPVIPRSFTMNPKSPLGRCHRDAQREGVNVCSSIRKLIATSVFVSDNTSAMLKIAENAIRVVGEAKPEPLCDRKHKLRRSNIFWRRRGTGTAIPRWRFLTILPRHSRNPSYPRSRRNRGTEESGTHRNKRVQFECLETTARRVSDVDVIVIGCLRDSSTSSSLFPSCNSSSQFDRRWKRQL